MSKSMERAWPLETGIVRPFRQPIIPPRGGMAPWGAPGERDLPVVDPTIDRPVAAPITFDTPATQARPYLPGALRRHWVTCPPCKDTPDLNVRELLLCAEEALDRDLRRLERLLG